MDLEALGNLGEFVAAVATLATLIYLAIQVRNNTVSVRSATHQQQVDSATAVHTMITKDAELAKLVLKADTDFSALEDHERVQLLFFYVNHFNMWHYQFMQNRKGLFDAAAWVTWDNGWAAFAQMQHGMREAWAAFGDIYGDEFFSHVEKHLSKPGIDSVNSGRLAELMKRNGT